MGHKKVCINCRKAYNLNSDYTVPFSLTCPNCGQISILLNHKFRPPEKNNTKEWKLVKFLVDNGFNFSHQLDDGKYVQYPTTMKDAIVFINKYKKQVQKPDSTGSKD